MRRGGEERERAESGNCLFADDFEFPPLHLFRSPPTLFILPVQL